MSPTFLERDMLKTPVPERDMAVTPAARPPWPVAGTRTAPTVRASPSSGMSVWSACPLCPISWPLIGGPPMVADSVACGVRRAAVGGATDPEPTALPEDHTPHATRHTPTTERCPACGQERPHSELWRKGTRLVCCTPCYWARRLEGRQRWEQANRARRLRAKREGGRPCPAYVAWTVERWPHGVCVVYAQPGCPEASVMPAYGACSCGEAGCVHLVVACLAQQGGGSNG